jgi:tripartite-type tricarboxylate transporter receptor subunit TctC
MAPAGTPSDIVSRLNNVTNEALGDPSVRTRLEQIGYTIAGGSPADFANAVKSDIARFKALNINID